MFPERCRIPFKLLAIMVSGLTLGGCSSSGNLASYLKREPIVPTRAASGAHQVATHADLRAATTYWATAYGKNPRDPKAAVNFARNLKAMGAKRKAFGVLQQAIMYNSADKQIMSEYGRLALEMGQVNLAQKLLRRAVDPQRPDWRLVSAQGVAMAKLGRHAEAQPYFLRALELAPGQASVMNNLALAYALDGQAPKAEQLLKRAAHAGPPTRRMRQNLALVLGLQGKFEEAKQVANVDLPKNKADANMSYLRRMVKVAPTRPGLDPMQDDGSGRASQAPVALASAPHPMFRGTSEPKRLAPPAKKTVLSGWSTNTSLDDWDTSASVAR